MRLDKVMLSRGIVDPKTLTGSRMDFRSGHLERTPEDYDLYLVGGDIYICREGNIAVVTAAGVAISRGEDAAKKAFEMAKRFPRPSASEG